MQKNQFFEKQKVIERLIKEEHQLREIDLANFKEQRDTKATALLLEQIETAKLAGAQKLLHSLELQLRHIKRHDLVPVQDQNYLVKFNEGTLDQNCLLVNKTFQEAESSLGMSLFDLFHQEKLLSNEINRL